MHSVSILFIITGKWVPVRELYLYIEPDDPA